MNRQRIYTYTKWILFGLLFLSFPAAAAESCATEKMDCCVIRDAAQSSSSVSVACYIVCNQPPGADVATATTQHNVVPTIAPLIYQNPLVRPPVVSVLPKPSQTDGIAPSQRYQLPLAVYPNPPPNRSVLTV